MAGKSLVAHDQTRMPPATASAPPQPPQDARLLAALRTREPQAALEIWTRFSPVVRRLLVRFFGPEEDVRDLTQDVFLRLFSRIGQLRADLTLESFVVGITFGVARNEARRRQVRRIVGLTRGGQSPDVSAPGLDEEGREAVARLYRVLEKISPTARALFVARSVEGMSMEDIAAIHGWSVGTAKRRVAKALARVDAALAREPALAAYLTGSGERP